MKRTQRFIIGLVAAGITFATLTATIGTEHWKRGHFFHHGYYYHDHHKHHDHDNQDQKFNNDSDKDDQVTQ